METSKNDIWRCGNGESVPIMTSIPTKPLILVLWVKVIRIIVRILRRGDCAFVCIPVLNAKRWSKVDS